MSIALVITNQYFRFPTAALYGCYNDGDNFVKTLRKIDPFVRVIRMRDNLPRNNPYYSTKANILREFTNLCKSPANKLYFYYSGHGTSITDYNSDEKVLNLTQTGRTILNLASQLEDSCIVTNDFDYLNIISDDEFSNILINLRHNQTLYAFMDSCNSGTGFDLAYVNMGQYSSNFTSTTMAKLRTEINNKCTLLSASYPDKTNIVKGNVLLFSGTRDNSYSYEGYVNNQVSGYFTNLLCWLLSNDVSTLSIKDFYYLIIAFLNIQLKSTYNATMTPQIPVLTCSQNINLNNRLTDFRLVANKTQIPKLLTIMPVFKGHTIETVVTPITNKKLVNAYIQNKIKYY